MKSKIVFSIIVLISIFYLTDANAQNLRASLPGTWTASTEGALFMTFYPNGAYEETMAGGVKKGTWSVDGNNIIINITETPTMEPVSTFTYTNASIEDDVLTYTFGDNVYKWYRYPESGDKMDKRTKQNKVTEEK